MSDVDGELIKMALATCELLAAKAAGNKKPASAGSNCGFWGVLSRNRFKTERQSVPQS
ncbi:MAG: hypothetical protein ABL903_04955 [Methylococcales bacterium]